MPHVDLIAHTANPEQLVAAAAKLCYSQTGASALLEGLDEEKTAGFVRMLASLGHASPIEHASFTFAIEGVSRSLLAQITRHRIASYSVQSQRYVSENAFEYITPPEIAAVPEAMEAFEQAMRDAQAHYTKIAKLLEDKHTAALVEAGAEEKAARRKASKQAIEDARFVLPNACETKMVVTMNARSLHNFFAHRCCNRAQWEIHALADKMLRLVLDAAPMLFAAAGPPCLGGACPEGGMSCGMQNEVRKKYKSLYAGNS